MAQILFSLHIGHRRCSQRSRRTTSRPSSEVSWQHQWTARYCTAAPLSRLYQVAFYSCTSFFTKLSNSTSSSSCFYSCTSSKLSNYVASCCPRGDRRMDGLCHKATTRCQKGPCLVRSATAHRPAFGSSQLRCQATPLPPLGQGCRKRRVGPRGRAWWQFARRTPAAQGAAAGSATPDRLRDRLAALDRPCSGSKLPAACGHL